MKQSMEATQISFLLRFGVVAGILILSFHLVEALFGTLSVRLLLLKSKVGEQLVEAVGSHHTTGSSPSDLTCVLHWRTT